MSKRSAAASAGSRKAAKTPAGRDRCDRCGKAIFGSQVQEEVNGRCRHADCWPAYKQRRAVFFARLNLCSSVPEFPFTTLAVVQQFNREVDQLIEREALMRALNCVSKMVRFELLRLPNSSWPVLALARDGQQRAPLDGDEPPFPADPKSCLTKFFICEGLASIALPVGSGVLC